MVNDNRHIYLSQRQIEREETTKNITLRLAWLDAIKLAHK